MNKEINPVQKIRVMPLGDSITRGKGGSSWRHHLRNLLKAEGIRIQYVGSSPHAPNFNEPWSDHYLALQQALDYNVEHEGWGGLKIHELTRLMGHESYPDFTIEELLEKNPADLILLMIGSNDFKDNYETDTAWQRLNRLVKMIVGISDATLLVASILPIFIEVDPVDSEKIRDYNTRIVEIIGACRSKGCQIGFVDMYPHFRKKEMLGDGLHPNIYGDQKIAKIWSQSIIALLKQKGI